jgi:hypothetical protein
LPPPPDNSSSPKLSSRTQNPKVLPSFGTIMPIQEDRLWSSKQKGRETITLDLCTPSSMMARPHGQSGPKFPSHSLKKTQIEVHESQQCHGH